MLALQEEEKKNLVVNTKNFKYEINEIKNTPNLKPIREYFDKLLKLYPLVSQIKNENVRADFEILKTKVLELMTIADINMKLIDDAENSVKGLMMNSHSMMQICPVNPKSEENQLVEVKKVNSPLIDVKSLKDNYLLNESLKNVLENCSRGKVIGEKITSSVNYEKNIAEINQLIAKIYDHLKIKTIIQNIDEQTRWSKMVELTSKLTDLDASYKIRIKEHRESNYARSNLKSSIALRNDEILMLQSDIYSIETQIKNLKEEFEMIQNNEVNLKKIYKAKRQKLQEDAEQRMTLEISHRETLKLKINDQISKVLDNLMSKKETLTEKINFIIIIDRSISMSNYIKSVNKAVINFLEELKKINSDDLFFTIIYFETSAQITGDTILLKTCSNISDYVNLEANGLTNYSKGFQIASSVAKKNKSENIINRQILILFTDGADGGDRTELYKYAKEIKNYFFKNVNIYVRGLGLDSFDNNATTHLKHLSNIINENSNPLSLKKNIEIVSVEKDINKIVDFFKKVSLNYVEYYKDLKENIQRLEVLKKQLTDDQMNIYDENSNLLEKDMQRLEKMENYDLSDQKEKEKLLTSLNISIENLIEKKREKISFLHENKNLLSQHETDLEIINQNDTSKLVDDFSKKIVSLKEDIMKENIIIREIETKNTLSEIDANNKMFPELGFCKLDDYKEFFKLIQQFSDIYSSIQSTSSKYGENITNFSCQISKFANNINDAIKSSRTQEINKLFDEKGGTQNLSGLVDAIYSAIDVNQKSFTKDHVKTICNYRHILVEIMSQSNNRVNYAITKKIHEEFFKNDKKKMNNLKEEIEDMNKEINKYEQLSDNPMEEQIEKIEKEIEKISDILNDGRDEEKESRDEWNKRKEELKQKKDNLKEEKEKLKLNNKNLKVYQKEDLNRLKESLKEKELEKKTMETELSSKDECFKAALIEIINVLEMWDRVAIELKNHVQMKNALSHFAKEINNY